MKRGADLLAEVLDRTGLRGRVYCQSRARAPWGLRLAAQSGAVFHVVSSGACWLLRDGERVQLAAGDVVLLPRGAAHALADAPRSPKIDLESWLAARGQDVGLATLGSERGSVSEMLCGLYQFDASPSAHPVLELLPDVLHLRPGAQRAELAGTLASLCAERKRGPLGSDLIVSRLLDVMFVQLVRAWLESAPAGTTGWIGALQDDVLARALAAIHAEPARDWTVEALAGASKTSRATLARRFVAEVGEPPLAYLTRVRLQEAARRLAHADEGLAAIAADVGYATEFAFSRAFRRQYGEPPGRFRARVRSAG